MPFIKFIRETAQKRHLYNTGWEYSQISLSGHSLNRTANLVPAEFHLYLCNWTLSKADTSKPDSSFGPEGVRFRESWLYSNDKVVVWEIKSLETLHLPQICNHWTSTLQVASWALPWSSNNYTKDALVRTSMDVCVNSCSSVHDWSVCRLHTWIGILWILLINWQLSLQYWSNCSFFFCRGIQYLTNWTWQLGCYLWCVDSLFSFIMLI